MYTVHGEQQIPHARSVGAQHGLYLYHEEAITAVALPAPDMSTEIERRIGGSRHSEHKYAAQLCMWNTAQRKRIRCQMSAATLSTGGCESCNSQRTDPLHSGRGVLTRSP